MVQELEQVPEDLGDEAQVKARTKKVKLKASEADEVLAQLMSRPEGRRWLYSVLEMCHIFHTPFSDNPTQMAFNVGVQNVGIRLTGDVARAAPELYLLMLKEKADG